MLTLGLAACNSTGTKTPVNPGGGAGQGDTSELGTARTAAKTAMDAAEKAKVAAEKARDDLKALVMAIVGNEALAEGVGVAGVQTNAKALAKYKEAADAADDAETAYNQAKAAYDKAAAATTVTAAAEARLDAEAEQKKAEAAQKTADDAAKDVKKYAPMEVKVAYADGKATYSVGDTSIMPGSAKLTTEVGGKTQKITGLQGMIKSNEHTKRGGGLI